MRKKINYLIILLLLLNVFGLFIDFKNTTLYGGNDLRIRVVGARVFSLKINPYTFHPGSQTKDELIDPALVNDSKTIRLTVTPFVLFISLPFAFIPYLFQRYFWFLFQWLAFILSVFLLMSCSKSKLKRKIILAISLAFSASFIWRLHVELGQIYILYAFLASLAYKLLQKPAKFFQFLSGFVIGITSALRLPFLLFFPTMFLIRKFNFLAGFISGLFLGFVLPFFIKLTIWSDYISSVFLISNVKLTSLKEGANQLINPTLTRIFEHMPSLGRNWRIGNNDTSIRGFFYAFFSIHLSIWVLFAMFLIFMAFILFYLILKRRNFPISFVFAVSYLLVLISEFFLPVARLFYYDIQWYVVISFFVLAIPTHIYFKTKLNILWILVFLWLIKLICCASR
jgi:hypothetical protein